VSQLDRDCRDQSRKYLAAMFEHIRETESDAQEVLGNSWMYNLSAYRELFPPQYTQQMPISNVAEYHYLALWGQCYDRYWQVNKTAAGVLLERAARVNHPKDVLSCFPLQIRTPRAPIEQFFLFYEKK
jgi:hypothetical protein